MGIEIGQSRRRLEYASMVAPACLLFGLFVLYPLIAGVWLSFHEWRGFGERAWAGLANYRRLWEDPEFRIALANTLRWLLVYAAAPLAGLGLALLVNQTLAGMRLVRALFFMPFVVSPVVVGLIFAWFLHARFGLFNALREAAGLAPVAPLESENAAIYALIGAGLWPQIAYCMILYLAGLAALRPAQIEAARLDGAAGWTLLRHVVLPQLRPVHFIVGMVCAVSALRAFDYVAVMTLGGPYGRSSVLGYYMYEKTFLAGDYGQGAAAATVLLALMAAVVGALFWRMLRAERS